MSQKLFTRVWVSVVILSLVGTAAVSLADSSLLPGNGGFPVVGPVVVPPAPAPIPVPVPAPIPAPVAVPGQPLNADGLLAMLQNLGYNPEVKLFSSGSPYYKVTINHNGYSVYMYVEIDKGFENLVMLEVPLASIPSPDKIAAGTWEKIMAKNDAILPAYFVYREGEKFLYLYRMLDNHDLSKDVLRNELEGLFVSVRDTSGDWGALQQAAA
jgi:hypothetical protein